MPAAQAARVLQTLMKNLLVELLVEELPPKALKGLGEAFGRLLVRALVDQGLADAESAPTVFASPRRLAVHARNVRERAENRSQSQKLMPVSVGLDAAGRPTPALLKKLQALGAPDTPIESLRRALDGKAEALYLDSISEGVSLTEGLQRALQDAITKLPIPKVMSYQLQSDCDLPGWTSVSFVRPAHGLVALHGQDVVPVQALGLRSGRTTQGHRFESRVNPVAFEHADEYAERLAHDGAVIAGFAQRREEIERQIAEACRSVGAGARVVPDDALLDEVTALVERPHVLVCSFDAQFLEVPQECLILTMKANQKYFPLLDAAGKLTHQFLVVSNIAPQDTGAVRGGNERVVRPRLADAKFFFDQDRRNSLESRIPGLDKVVYHNRLGTQGERMQRVRAIAAAITQAMGAHPVLAQVDQAARLAKTDLLTDMVGEFPELQGVMGGYYARHDGLGAVVAEAIEDHYRPRFAGDALPRSQVGIIVALADKLETLVGMFGIGNLPTGDKDPYALRRHGLGVVRMLVERALPVSPQALIALAAEAFAGRTLQDVSASLGDFLTDRLKSYLKDGGASMDEVDAVIHVPGLADWANVPKRLLAIRAFNALPEASALAAANKRIGNILKKVQDVDPHVSEVLLQEPAEIALYAAMQKVIPTADTLYQAGEYAASLQALAALRAPVDTFFVEVMVNAEALDLRLNRLGLLRRLHNAMNQVADLGRLAA